MVKNIKYIICLFLLSNCGKKSPCFKSTGNIIVEDRELNVSISDIVLNNGVKLVLTQSSVPFLKIKGGENLLPYIKTNIENKKLVITNSNKCNFLRSFKNEVIVYLGTDDLKYLNFEGTENIETTNTIKSSKFIIETNEATGNCIMDLDLDTLNIFQHGGPADFNLTGASGYSYLYSNGNGWFNMEKFNSLNVFVNHNGTGDFYLKFINSLYIDLFNIGNINYCGNTQNVTIGVCSGKGVILNK